jgi:hypothetical protein
VSLALAAHGQHALRVSLGRAAGLRVGVAQHDQPPLQECSRRAVRQPL